MVEGGDSLSPMVAVPPVGTVMVPPPSREPLWSLVVAGQGAGAGEVAAGEVEGAGAGPGAAGEVEGAAGVVVAGAGWQVVGAGARGVDRVGDLALADLERAVVEHGQVVAGHGVGGQRGCEVQEAGGGVGEGTEAVEVDEWVVGGVGDGPGADVGDLVAGTAGSGVGSVEEVAVVGGDGAVVDQGGAVVEEGDSPSPMVAVPPVGTVMVPPPSREPLCSLVVAGRVPVPVRLPPERLKVPVPVQVAPVRSGCRCCGRSWCRWQVVGAGAGAVDRVVDSALADLERAVVEHGQVVAGHGVGGQRGCEVQEAGGGVGEGTEAVEVE